MSSNLKRNEMGAELGSKQDQAPPPKRLQRLRLKTEHYYDVKLPTYEESQRKYAKFMKALNDNPNTQCGK